MGTRIELQPDRTFVVEGSHNLSGTSQRLGGDRIEAFSYLVAGLVTGGQVRILGCAQDRLVTAISTLQRMGAEFAIDDEGIVASVGPDGLRPAAVRTDPHPGFMTDWQPGLVVLCSRPLTVIDCAAALGLASDETDWRGRRAVVVEHEGHLYGLLVDGADDIVAALDEPRPLGADPGPGWQRAALGRVETEAGAVLLLDIGALIADALHD